MFLSAKLPRIEREEISKVKGRGVNTFLVKGENVVYQIDNTGLPKEFALSRAQRKGANAFTRLNDETIAFDPGNKNYVLKIGSSFFTVNLPERVKACSNKLVSKNFGQAKLSDQMVVIGPDNTSVARHGLHR